MRKSATQVDPGGVAEQRRERRARRLVRDTLSCAGPRWRTRPGATTSDGHQTIAGSTVAGARERGDERAVLDPVLEHATSCPARPARASQRRGRRRLVRLDGEQDPGDGAGRGGIGGDGRGEPVLAAVGQLDDRRRRGAAPVQGHGVPGALGGRRERGADRAGADDGDLGHRRAVSPAGREWLAMRDIHVNRRARR